MPQSSAVELVKQGVALARAGDKAEARPLLRQAVELDPDSEAAWLWVAGVAESPQEALTALERVLALNPANEKALSAAHAARLQLAIAAARADKKPRARVLLRLVTAAEPDNELAWMWLANIAESPAEAATCLEQVLAINPANGLARATLQRCRAAQPVCRPVDRKVVLVVDHRAAVRDHVVLTLEQHGYEVRAAAEGFEAVDLIRKRGAPDLIVLAAALPGGMDGYQLCKLLRENRSTARRPILLLSEKSSLFARMRGGLAGATAELAMPCSPAELLRVAEEHCSLETPSEPEA